MERVPQVARAGQLAASCFALALISTVLVAPAHAAWIPGGNVLASGPSNQTNPLIVSDGSGGVIVFWTDDGLAAGSQMLAQHVGGDGTFLWSPGGLPVAIPYNNNDPYALPVTDQQGGSIAITATNLGNGHAQRVNPAGASQWGAGGANVYTTPPLNSPIYPVSIAAGGTNPTTDPAGMIAVWDEKISSLGTDDIYTQRLDASGTAMWGSLANPAVVCNAAGDQTVPVVCTDGPSGPSNTHGAYVAWDDPRASVFQTIYINRISNQGVAAWPNGVQVLSMSTLSIGPYIDYFGSNSALVVWFDTRRSGNTDLYAQKVLPTGTMAWTAEGIPICEATGSRTLSLMTPSGSGGEILAWVDSRTDIADVYAQAIDANGNRLWGTGGTPVCVQPNRQLVDGLVPDGAGGAFAFWFDKRNGTNSDLYGQHLNSSGTSLWTANGMLLVPLHVTPGILQMQALPDGVGGFILAWHDKVGTNYDSFISRFNSSGNTAVVAAEPVAPGAFRLALASPNPSRNGAQFSVELPAAGVVSAEVMDLEGREVRELAGSERLSAGPHALAWDGRTASGERAGPGIYFAVARLGAELRTIKLVELR